MAEYIAKEPMIEEMQRLIDNVSRNYPKATETELIILKGKYEAFMEYIKEQPAADVQPVDKDNMHIIYIGRKAYMAENTIMELMKKMDIIRDSLAHIENYFDTYAETIRQINACVGRCTDITEVKYFIDRIKENCGYD